MRCGLPEFIRIDSGLGCELTDLKVTANDEKIDLLPGIDFA